jgi:hypothetical protein
MFETCLGKRNSEVNIIILLILLASYPIVDCIDGFPYLNYIYITRCKASKYLELCNVLQFKRISWESKINF